MNGQGPCSALDSAKLVIRVADGLAAAPQARLSLRSEAQSVS